MHLISGSAAEYKVSQDGLRGTGGEIVRFTRRHGFQTVKRGRSAEG